MTEQKWIKSNEEWSSQLWTQFMKLRKKPEKNSGIQWGLNFEPVTSRYRCDALTNRAMKPLVLHGSWSIICLYVRVKEMNVINVYEIKNCRSKIMQMKNDPRTGTYEHIIDELPRSLACIMHARSTLDYKTSLFLLNARARTIGTWNFSNLTFHEKASTPENGFLFSFLSSVTVLQHSDPDWKDIAEPLFVFSSNQKSYVPSQPVMLLLPLFLLPK